MNFREKFETMVDLIEENVEKDSQEMAPIIGKTLGINGRLASDSFTFITSISFSKYVRCRKLDRIIEEIRNHEGDERDVIAEVASKYGYSDRSTFDRAFTRDYNVTPAEVINKGMSYKAIEKLTLEAVLDSNKGDMMTPERIDEKTTAAVIDNLINNGSMVINLESKQDRDLLNVIFDCQALHGLTTEQVLLAYELSDDKTETGISRACEAISVECNDIRPDDIPDDLYDCLYLVVNNNLYFEEAEKIVSDIRNGSNIDIRRIDQMYLDMVVKYNYENGLVLENLPYDVYVKVKPMILHSLNAATGLDIKAEEDGTITALLFREACTLLAIDFTKEELQEFSEKTSRVVDLMLASITNSIWIPREEATAVIEDLDKLGIENWHDCEEGYKAILFSPFKRGIFRYSAYIELYKDLNDYGITDEHEIHEVIRRTTEKGWDGPFDEVVDEILYKARMANKYQLSLEAVEELGELANRRVSWEEVCAAYTKDVGKKLVIPIESYGVAMTHLNDDAKERYNKLVFTLGEKLALMLSLNCGRPYQQVKTELEDAFSEYGMDFYFSDYLYYLINKVSAEHSIEEEYNALPYAAYRNLLNKAEKEVEAGEIRGLDLTFFSAVAFKCNLYESLDESFSEIANVLKRIRDIIPDSCNLGLEGTCFMYAWNENLVKKKPHELDDKELLDLLRDGIMCDMSEEEPRQLTESEVMHNRMHAEAWAPALGWIFSAPVTREQF